jgi:polar amino acid transport system substrate-binding protein
MCIARLWPGCLLWLLTAFTGVQAQTVASITGHPDWPPFSWRSHDKIVGVGPELTEIVFHDLGLQVVSKSIGNWKREQVQAEAGLVDVVVAIYLTEERGKYLAYTAAPFMEDANVVWVAKGKGFHFSKWEDLIGKTGCAMLGESYGEQFDLFIRQKLRIDWVNTPQQILQKLVLGRADYYPFSLYGGQIQVRQLGFADRVVALPQVISKAGVYIAISRKSNFVKYLPQIEAAVAKRRADGTVDRLVQKYLAIAAQSQSQRADDR